jgi:hypothetical protein
MFGMTAYMTLSQMKMDRDSIRSQMQMEAIKARMNQCSSLDCTVKEDVCKMQTVEKDRKFLGIKTGTKYVPISESECSFCADEVEEAYDDPYTGETKMMSLYEICLRNVVGGLLNRNPCYDLIATSNKYPGMISDADIRRCFLNLPPPTRKELSFPFSGVKDKPAEDKAKEEEKKKDDKKAAAAGSPAGSGGASSPSGAPDKKPKEFIDRSGGPGYSNRGIRAGGGPAGGDYYFRRDTGAGTFGGAENAAQSPEGSGLRTVATGDEELSIKTMTRDVHNATNQSINTRK